MITTTPTQVETPFSIHPATRMGVVHLTVADLEHQIAFYQRVIGLQQHWQEGSMAGLGTGGEDLLRLTEVKDARRYHRTTGIYHFALLLPDRRELARAIGRLYALRTTNYPTDHILTKSTYLDDPEGNNIEIYTESPEDGTFGIVNGEFFARRADGRPSNGREPMDLEALFSHLAPDDPLDQPLPPTTKIGHVHLYVADLDASLDFYHHVLGFDNMGVSHAWRAGFVSAGGYHHHIGFNTWVGRGAPPPPPGALGLRFFTVVLPDQSELDRVLEQVRQAGIPIEKTEDGLLVRDPSQNGVMLADRTGGTL
jgi:catechol 2,3-dioxygenase